MLRAVFVTVTLIFLSAGCTNTQPQSGQSSTVAATDVTKLMIGRWGIDGEVALVISLDGERIKISAPENDTWRIDVMDAKIVDDSIQFVQKHYLLDGTFHPFNGEACHSTAKLVDETSLELGMTTAVTPEYDSDILTRIK